MRRLFSTFARGQPGAGLLLLRAITGAATVSHGVRVLLSGAAMESAIVNGFAVCLGFLLLFGLWTPIAGMFVAATEIWSAIAHPGDPWNHILLGSLGAALALLGPGAWSVDAYLFGWKRLEIRDRKR